MEARCWDWRNGFPVMVKVTNNALFFYVRTPREREEEEMDREECLWSARRLREIREMLLHLRCQRTVTPPPAPLGLSRKGRKLNPSLKRP